MFGRVKWFNKDVGYGFINGENNEEIFVHHSSLSPVRDDCYRFLIEGEYVQYDEGESNNDRYTKQAINVKGINGGELMCEVKKSIPSNTRKPKTYVARKNNKTSASAEEK